MHEIDRTTLEYQEGPFETEGAFESAGFGAGEFGETGEIGEQETAELASELLEVSNEQELDHFLGDLVKRAGRAFSGIASSPIGQALGGVLKGVAKKGLSMAGGALGGAIGGPIGSKIGTGLADAASSALGLEIGEVSGEDRSFEGAKQFVRLAGDAVKHAASAPPGDPRAIAQSAAVAAAQTHAPGLLPGHDSGPLPPIRGYSGPQARSGRWFRHGNKIVVIC
jgi:hypothetical protein